MCCKQLFYFTNCAFTKCTICKIKYLLTDWLIDWFIDQNIACLHVWLVACLIDGLIWLVDWLVDWSLMVWLIDWQVSTRVLLARYCLSRRWSSIYMSRESINVKLNVLTSTPLFRDISLMQRRAQNSVISKPTIRPTRNANPTDNLSTSQKLFTTKTFKGRHESMIPVISVVTLAVDIVVAIFDTRRTFVPLKLRSNTLHTYAIGRTHNDCI